MREIVVKFRTEQYDYVGTDDDIKQEILMDLGNHLTTDEVNNTEVTIVTVE